MERRIFLAIALFAIWTPSIAVVVCTWTGAGADGNWSTAANWNNCGGAHALPADADILVFPDSVPRLTNTNNLSKLSASQLKVFGALHVTGNAIQLTNGIIANVPGSASPPLIDIDISLNGAQTFSCLGERPLQLAGVNLLGHPLTIDGGCNVTIADSLVGTGSLTKNGPSNLLLTATNAYIGPTTINGGFIVATRNSSLGATGPGNETTVNAGATLSLGDGPIIGEDLFLAGDGAPSIFTVGALAGGSGVVNGNITLTADASINAFDVGSDITLAGNISGGFVLTKIGEGTLHWLGDGQPTGTIVTGGALELAGSATAVTSSSVLAGDGDCSGAVTVVEPGILAPGPLATSRPGTLTMADLTWTAGADFAIQLGATSASSDQAAVKGNLSSSSTGAFEFQFSDAASPPVAGVTYTVISFSQSTGFSVSDFSFVYTGTGPGSSMTGSFALTATELQFTPATVVSDLLFRANME